MAWIPITLVFLCCLLVLYGEQEICISQGSLPRYWFIEDLEYAIFFTLKALHIWGGPSGRQKVIQFLNKFVVKFTLGLTF